MFKIHRLLPGLLLTFALTALAWGVEQVERHWLGQAWFEALVLALILGTVARSIFGLHPAFEDGVHFSGKTVLEIGVMLLGASFSVRALGDFGPLLIGAIAGVVFIALALSYGIGRTMGLPHQLAVLVACGNSICGNSAIMAAAPVIDASAEDVAASIAFTAALGIIVVLVLPLALPGLGLAERSYGILAGMTVYAVPQVIAATAPVGLVAIQVGTLAKLIRVLMLGPVVVALGLGAGRKAGLRPGVGRLVPWFIVGFLCLMGLRSLNVIPVAVIGPVGVVSTILTTAAMGALGLSVDLGTMMHANGRVLTSGVLSIVMLLGLSLGALALLGLW
ncbi:putative sulfate exporter family transporter [Devosia rhodophyticola]|uniref:Sulfate exporter family transporter n=1 Tax=Devosia rhodophyticola TaxID=3026423 RepID=A0ABY7YTS1_9HYPH|nr:putative sulfate exporter family transporter [Devosia rhodophyticola]WDR04572.1 putative sulfate exporter family transporter [Devosia rhodophyticola]